MELAEGAWEVRQGDSLEVLKALPDACVDAVVTDPPYGLSREPDIAEVMRHWLNGDRYEHGGAGFMGTSWDSFVPGPEYWREVRRVMRPGAHLLAMSGTRTWDLLSIAIRFAGFENRDTLNLQGGPPALSWLHGQGFPKGLDVGAAIDAQLGAEREVVGVGCSGNTAGMQLLGPSGIRGGEYEITAPATPEAEQWDGWNVALKPAWEVALLFRKPLAERTVAANVLKHGTGALNVDGCRVEPSDDYAENAVTQGLNTARTSYEWRRQRRTFAPSQAGRWPSNLLLTHADCNGACAPGCPVRLLDAQSGERASGGKQGETLHKWTANGRDGIGIETPSPRAPDEGGASRFFPTFRYCPKPSRAEREAGLESLPTRTRHRVNAGGLEHDPKWAPVQVKNPHPTVKPVALMRWLCRLITPPEGLLLDLFMGSGTTGVAAILEGFRFLGIDQEAEYCEIARHRIRATPPPLPGLTVEPAAPGLTVEPAAPARRRAPATAKAPAADTQLALLEASG